MKMDHIRLIHYVSHIGKKSVGIAHLIENTDMTWYTRFGIAKQEEFDIAVPIGILRIRRGVAFPWQHAHVLA